MSNKAESARIQTAKDYEMKVSSIQTPNRFQTLQDFTPLPYSVIVETPASKAQKVPTQQNPTIQISSNFDADTPYFTKSTPEHMLITSYTQVPNYNTLQVFTSKLFPQNCNWLDDPLKTQKFYELILVDSGSVEITHTQDRKIPSQISYSKCVIKKVLSSTEWASLWTTKEFSIHFIPKGYTYQDYRMAWYRTFFYRPFNHSWFFTFHSNCMDQFPIWIYEWWLYFGPVPDIYPPTILKAFQTWIAKTTGDIYKKPLAFHKSLKVPWIFCWSYKLINYYNNSYPLSLVREFKVKWWTKFTLELCTEDIVKNFIQTGKRDTTLIQQVSRQITQMDKAKPATPAKTTKAIIQDNISSDSEDGDDDSMKQFLEFQKFKKLQKQLKTSKAHSKASSQGSSTDPMGGPCAQDPFDM